MEATVQGRLEAARRLCLETGERLSPARLRTLELVLAADGPVKAYDLAKRFHDGGPASVITIYRALSFWAKMGVVRKVETLNAFIAVALPGETSAFLLCGACGRTQEVTIDVTEEVGAVARALGFQLGRLTLEAGGRCRDCSGRRLVVAEPEV